MASELKIRCRIKTLMRNKQEPESARKGVSFDKLAKLTGVPKTSLYYISRNERMNLSIENIYRLLKYFDCSFEELFSIKELESDEAEEKEE